MGVPDRGAAPSLSRLDSGFACARLELSYLRDGPPALIGDGRNRDPVPKSIAFQFPGSGRYPPQNIPGRFP